MDQDRELKQLESEMLKASTEYQEQLLHGALTAEEVAMRLNIPVDEVTRRLGDHQLLGIFGSGEWRFPEVQFQGGEVLPGIPVVLKILSESNVPPFSQLAWLVEPHQTLGASPADLLQLGDIQRVTDAAWAVAAS